ncbi:MAG TPA: hypothetical protein VHW03_06440 [Chthoniobacterales bacterium]|jgi:hypothetical protein|nr:hypothetical protein [Chthoniobacterales bacterium]
MSTYQQNRLAMYLALLSVMTKYNTVWTAMTAIADMVTRLQDLTSSIQETSGIQGSPLTGISGGKRRKRMDMMGKTVALAGDVHALAVKTGDADMEAKSDLELTDLVRMGENVVAPRCQAIHDYAMTNSATLVSGYGVAATDIGDLQASISAFPRPSAKPARPSSAARKQPAISPRMKRPPTRS